jgi:hypothetical protein
MLWWQWMTDYLLIHIILSLFLYFILFVWKQNIFLFFYYFVYFSSILYVLNFFCITIFYFKYKQLQKIATQQYSNVLYILFLQNVVVMLLYQTYLVIPSVTWILSVPLLPVVHLWHSSKETSTFTWQ